MNWELKQRIIEEYGSQVDFAQTIKVNETLVSKIVRGRRAKALGCKPNDIFANEV
jgi:plasmid maintenance system antidote protein VapI